MFFFVLFLKSFVFFLRILNIRLLGTHKKRKEKKYWKQPKHVELCILCECDEICQKWKINGFIVVCLRIVSLSSLVSHSLHSRLMAFHVLAWEYACNKKKTHEFFYSWDHIQMLLYTNNSGVNRMLRKGYDIITDKLR